LLGLLMMKTCFKCLLAKPMAEFYKHAQMGDGHLNKCKECSKADVKKHRQDNWESVRAYDRMRASQPHRVATRQRIVGEYAAQYPVRKKANTAVSNALRDGRLKKQPCWVCGEKAVAHHPDYDRPLDVVWLCQPHHKQAHALVREPATEYA
jgi:hypothetical protein